MKKILTVLAALTVVASFSSVSWAIPFSQDAGFDTSAGTLISDDAATPENDIRWSTTVPGGVPPAGDVVVAPTDPNQFNTITWGVANNSGGLDIDGIDNFGQPLTGDPNTEYSGLRVLGFAGDAPVDTWTTISRVYHQNRAITDTFFTLQSAVIRSVLTVGTQDSDDVAFTFEETPNVEPCGDGTSSTSVCPDRFTLSDALFTPVYFTFGGQTYLAEFQFANLQNAIFEFGPGPLELTLWTDEGVTSSLEVQMRLHAVPEPASMMLLGSGLLGMIGFRRKQS